LTFVPDPPQRPRVTVFGHLQTMAGKCVHKGCGKTFADPEEACVYHPGPPVFHEGQKGKDLGATPFI
jgi:hypothetical protein